MAPTLTLIRALSPFRCTNANAIIAIMMAVVCLAPAAPAFAKRMQAPGSRVSLELPDAFRPSPLFAGFMEIISSAAVIMLELPPEEYDRVAAGFTAEALAKKNITNVTTGKLDRQDRYHFTTGRQTHPRAVFDKFILIFKDTRNTAVVTFNVPQGSFVNGSIKREAVIKALSTARLEDKAAPSNDLFKLGYTGSFVLTGQPTGTTRIYKEKNASGPKDTQNIIAIAPSLNRLPIRDIKEFSQYAISTLKNVPNLTVTGTKSISIDNMAGHHITATGLRGASKTPVIVRQLILLPPDGGYIRLLAITKSTDEQRLAPEIDKLFASLKAAEGIKEN